MTRALGLELRDTALAAVAIDDAGKVVARTVVDAADHVGESAVQAVDKVAREAGTGALGIAANFAEPAVAAAIVSGLAGRYPGPYIERGLMPSGAAAAVAEAWIGAARDVADDVAFFAVADHAIGGIVRGGSPVLGSGGRAPSVAWLALNPVEREDYRKVGCVEAETAAAGIVRRLIWRVKAGDRSRVIDAAKGNFSSVTVDHVLNGARDGDGVAISVVRDTAKYLGMAAANMVVVADPDMLVLGGIMATAADLLLEPVRSEIARRLPRAMMERLAIAPAKLGADAVAIGAARLATAAFK